MSLSASATLPHWESIPADVPAATREIKGRNTRSYGASWPDRR
jgi:hypothetical protein